MPRPPLAIALLAFALAAPASAAAAVFFTEPLSRAAPDLYEGPSGELIQTIGCAQPANATPSLIRIGPPAGPVIGRIDFGNAPGCDIAAVYAPYANAPAGTYGATLTSIGEGHYADATVEPSWIIRGVPSCPDTNAAQALITLAAAGPTYAPASGPVGTIDFAGPSPSCALAGIFGQVDPSMLPGARLAVTKDGSGSGTVASTIPVIDCGPSCRADFGPGAVVTLVATPSAGSVFAGWSGDCTGAASCTVTMNAAMQVTATFLVAPPATHPLAVTKAGAGSGRVVSSPPGIDCGATCSATFPAGSPVSLTATPDAGATFTGWSGACTGTAACVVPMAAAANVTATFTPLAPPDRTLTVTRLGLGSGTVRSSAPGIECGSDCEQDYPDGTVVTLQAVAQAGSLFAGWSGACAGTGDCAVTMNAARAVAALFVVAAPSTFRLNVALTGGAGRVVAAQAGIDCGATCQADLVSRTRVTLQATPEPGSLFVGWSGGCAGTGACTVTMDAARSVTARFRFSHDIPRLANISTRMQVLTGNDVLIGGFIIGGAEPKTVVVRARGPSLVPFGVANALANPRMDLYAGQAVIASNDDWGSAANAAAIQASGFAPSSALESATLVTLSPGAYTAVVSGAGNATGVGIIEVFEVDKPEVPLANISTRGRVLTGGDVMIGGFIIQGDSPQTVVVRARGPSLAPFGIANALSDPVLQLYSGQSLLASNDDWAAGPDAALVQSTGFAPSDARESVIRVTLPPGAYTAIVSGKNGATGVGIIEVFAQ